MKRIVTATMAAALCATPLWAATETTTLKVPGMTCPVCPITVKKALQKVPGVSRIDVNHPRVEAFNDFNHAQFNGPSSVDGNIGSSTFGKVVSAAPPRILQGAMKFMF